MTVDEMEARLMQAFDFFGGLGKKVLIWTFTPRVSGTYTTLDGQTPDASDSIRLGINARIRTGLTHSDYLGCIDAAALVQDVSDPSRWRVDMGQPTTDGLHLSQALHRYVAEQTSSQLATLVAGA